MKVRNFALYFVLGFVLFIGLFSFLTACSSTARTEKVLWVSPIGSDTNDGLSSDSALLSLSTACKRANSGETIKLVGGDYHENEQCIAKNNIRIIGSGLSGDSKTTIFAPSSFDFTDRGTDNNPEGYIIRVEDNSNVTVDKIRFIGNSHKANGGIFVNNSNFIKIHDVKFEDFRISGLYISHSADVDVQKAHFINSGYEWGPGENRKFPEGGSLGNLIVTDVQNSLFGHMTFYTDGLFGYGIKGKNLKKVKFLHNDFDMYPFQSWRGVTPDNFDLEFHGGTTEMVELAHNTFRQTISLMGSQVDRYANVPYSVHVHHNMFDMKNGTYSIEIGSDKSTYDRNWFKNSWTAFQNFGDRSTDLEHITITHNVVENMSMRFLGLSGQIEDLEVTNNTVVLGEGGGQSNFITLRQNNNSQDWTISNNIIVGASTTPVDKRVLVLLYETSPQNTLKNVRVKNNLYKDIKLAIVNNGSNLNSSNNISYENNLKTSPNLSESLFPLKSSPAIDSGIAGFEIHNSFVGEAPDIGAFEFGRDLWQAGKESESDVEYLWAPASSVKSSFFFNPIEVDLQDSGANTIHYTLDGNEPTIDSPLYTSPILISEETTLKARTFNEDYGSVTTKRFYFEKSRKGLENIGLNKQYSASSSYDTSYTPEKAFDKVADTWIGWIPATNDPQPWIQVDLEEPRQIAFIELSTRSQVASSEAARRKFEVRASNDPSFNTYEVLGVRGGNPIPSGEKYQLNVNNQKKFRYIRIAKTASETLFIAELGIYGI